MVDGSELRRRALEAIEKAGLSVNLEKVDNYIDRDENDSKTEYLILVLKEKD